MTSPPPPAVRLSEVSLDYGKVRALDSLSLDIPSGCVVALIGPDGVGKSSLLSLISGARRIQHGEVVVLGADMALKRNRDLICPRIAYMPQGLGRNLYPTLSVEENLQFFARLFGHDAAERRRRIDDLTAATGLSPFLDRPAGKLSGGMKQKLGLCCALIHDPDLLILDEPTTGVDPLARAQFWDLIARIRRERPGMSVIVATAYMDEAQGFDWLVAMDAGRILDTGTPQEILARTHTPDLEAAFIALLPEARKRGHTPVEITPLHLSGTDDIAIEASDLTVRFGDFTAVDNVQFRIQRGEIFGFLGSNGCGKSTTMKVLTGLLPATSGQAQVFGAPVDAGGVEVKTRVGYMSQAFSLYGELTVRQNLVLHARLFHVPEDRIRDRVAEMARLFGLEDVLDALPGALPLGVRQRLSLAVAMVHDPELLILDEPTSGVDPVARDSFWRLLIELSRERKVTIFISTHFMNEAGRCDRISLMHAGKVLVSDPPAKIVADRGAASLEDAFIGYLVEAGGGTPATQDEKQDGGAAPVETPPPVQARPPAFNFSPMRLLSYTWRESLELRRDPVRATLALAGSLILMLVIGFGISMDVNDLRYAILDRDQTVSSQNYALNIAGSRYFLEQPPLTDYEDMDRRMRSGEVSLAIEIPDGFGRDLQRGKAVEIGAWFDGSMPQRAETVQGYIQGLHGHWLQEQARAAGIGTAGRVTVEGRYRYNPDVKSMPSMIPAVIPILLLMLPAMLTALSVVREKEMGSILNLYVTPVTRTEFILGKQLPYIGLAMINFLLLVLMAIFLFGVPVKGSFVSLCIAALIFCTASTGMGLLASAATKSQIAAMFFAMIGTLIPAMTYGGMINPVSSLDATGQIIGNIYPASHMFTISRGVFNKALGLSDMLPSLWPLALSAPVIVITAILLLRKQDR